jgi:hypothetical protein
MYLGWSRQSAVALVLCAYALAAPIPQATTERITVSREKVAEAMQSAGFATTAGCLQLLSTVKVPANASLHLSKVTRRPDGVVFAELTCQAKQCLPFYVLIHDAPSLERLTPRTPQSDNSISRAIHPLVDRGKPLRLLLEGDHCRIVVPAVSLESGMPGEIISVISQDRKRIFHAEIVSGTLVRGVL